MGFGGEHFELQIDANWLLCVCFFFVFRYETKRMEIEKWLQRMESRLEQMGKIATTADVLEAQQKEQKVKYQQKEKKRTHAPIFCV